MSDFVKFRGKSAGDSNFSCRKDGIIAFYFTNYSKKDIFLEVHIKERRDGFILKYDNEADRDADIAAITGGV